MLDKEAIRELSKAEAITAAGNEINRHRDDTLGVVALPGDFGTHDLEKFFPTRRRARGTMTTGSIGDFAEYAKLHAEVGAMCFVDAKAMKAVAVLNLGDPDEPGHADNRAAFTAEPTAAYCALLAKANGQALKQSDVAEFLEDWQSAITCEREGEPVDVRKAIAAVRAITIEGLKRLENTEKQLGTSRSAFEQVEAKSTEPLPTHFKFKAIPYLGLSERAFGMRIAILTGGDKPAITLRLINPEQAREEMAQELAGLVRGAIGDAMPVLVGGYTAGA